MPNFKVCSAIIHYDETSPHMHIVGVPIKYNCKTGMITQVGKTDVFTRTSLKQLQDKMRTLCIEEYNKEYNLDATLKQKLKGRNRDIHVSDMANYQETKDLIEKNQKTIDSINNKALELDNESNNIREKISNIRKAPVIKDSYIISEQDKKMIESYIDKVDKTNNEYKSIKGLSASLKNLNKTIKEDKNTIKVLNQNNQSLEIRVETLDEKVENQEKQITDLKRENINLKYQLQQLEQLFKKLINFLKRMINRKDKEEIYSEVVGDMYNNQIINEKTFDNILGYGEQDKEKDDSGISL